MSRRDCQSARTAVSRRQREQQHRQRLEREPDPQQQARLTARYQRETLGRVRVREPFYLYDLGLQDVCRGMSLPQANHRHPDVIRTTQDGRR